MSINPRPLVILVSHFSPYPSIHGNRSRLAAWLTWLRAPGFRVRYILQPLDLDGDRGLWDLRDAVDRLDVIASPSRDVRQTIAGSGAAQHRSIHPGLPR